MARRLSLMRIQAERQEEIITRCKHSSRTQLLRYATFMFLSTWMPPMMKYMNFSSIQGRLSYHQCQLCTDYHSTDT